MLQQYDRNTEEHNRSPLTFSLSHPLLINHSCISLHMHRMFVAQATAASDLLFPAFAALDHPHSFSCKLELGSDQEIPSDWYPFVTMECEIVGAVVSQTRVKSLGTINDIQPQKHVTSWTRYHCQVRCFQRGKNLLGVFNVG